MEETLASQKMTKIDLISSLEKISSEMPERILKLEGFLQKENQKPSSTKEVCDEILNELNMQL